MLNTLIKFFLILSMTTGFSLAQSPWENLYLKWLGSYVAEFIDTEAGLKSYAYSSQYRLDDVGPSFFKKALPHALREISQYKLDNISEKKFSDRFLLSFNLSEMLLLTANLNATLKFHMFKENFRGPFFPQITVGVSYFHSALSFAFDGFNHYGTSVFLGLSKSANKNLKLFTGYKFGFNHISLDASIPTGESSIDFGADLNNLSQEMYLGANYLYGKRRFLELTSFILYNFTERHVYLKLESLGKVTAIGVGIYPMSAIKVMPYVRFQWSI